MSSQTPAGQTSAGGMWVGYRPERPAGSQSEVGNPDRAPQRDDFWEPPGPTPEQEVRVNWEERSGVDRRAGCLGEPPSRPRKPSRLVSSRMRAPRSRPWTTTYARISVVYRRIEQDPVPPVGSPHVYPSFQLEAVPWEEESLHRIPDALNLSMGPHRVSRIGTCERQRRLRTEPRGRPPAIR